MPHHITRRDFVNGAALAVAAGLTPLDQLLAQTAAPYPPALTGLRGSHAGAFEVMHGLAREGKTYSIDGMADEESYDLVVVGAGLAGLSAAWFYREQVPNARILILDNHDDFGGHAKRNEFSAGGRMILGYGGSESIVWPDYGKAAKRLFSALRLEPARFEQESVFHRTLYPGLKLSKATFFAKEAFGADKLVTGDPTVLGFDEFGASNPGARGIAAFLADCPLSDAARAGVLALYEGSKDFMAGKSKEEKLAILGKTSYRDFVDKICGLPKDAGDYFQGRLNDNFGLGIDAIAAYDAMEGGLPGAKGLGIADEFDAHGDEPYVHHFPDGNSSIARMIVRSLVKGVAPGRDMNDIVTARFDYGKLDLAGSSVRIRLNATAVIVRNEGKGVSVGYVQDGKLHRVRGRRTVVATYGMVMPYIVPEIPEESRDILSSNVKSPLLYTKVQLKSWESFVELGVHNIAAPMSTWSTVKLDYPVSLGAYQFPRDPKGPGAIHMVHVPLEPNQGLDARDQCRVGRQRLLETEFSVLEAGIRDQLQRMLGPGGFNAARDIEAITLNRWSHGYSYYWNSLYDDVEAGEANAEKAKKPIGRIALANSDTAWDAYAHSAIAEAARAVKELIGG